MSEGTLDQRERARGRALSAARLGLSTAIEDLEDLGHKEMAEDGRRALKRSYRMEGENAGPKPTAT